MIFKLVNNKEIHLFKSENPSFKELIEHTQQLYSLPNQDFTFAYKDNEGDSITISSEDDLKVLLEEVQQQTLKLHVQSSSSWTCKQCTFVNENGNVCQACDIPKDQTYQQNFVPPNWGFPPGPPPNQFPPGPPLGSMPQGYPPFAPPHFGLPPGPPPQMGNQQQQQIGGAVPGFYNPYAWGNCGQNRWGHHHHMNRQWNRMNNPRWARLLQIMNQPQYTEQKAKLTQLFKEIGVVMKQTFQQNQQFYQQGPIQWNQEDEQRAVRLSEVLQCTNEEAKQYLLLFKDLTLDEIVMITQNTQ